MILRAAVLADAREIQRLIADSASVLSRGDYSDEQVRALMGQAFGVDTQLIADGTYFVIVCDDAIVAAGGWSRRWTLSGGDAAKRSTDDRLLDPAVDAARIRAVFVAPSHARRGLGARLVEHVPRRPGSPASVR